MNGIEETGKAGQIAACWLAHLDLRSRHLYSESLEASGDGDFSIAALPILTILAVALFRRDVGTALWNDATP